MLDEVYTFARYLTRDATEAEDATQETYLRALRYFSGFSGELDQAVAVHDPAQRAALARSTALRTLAGRHGGDSRTSNRSGASGARSGGQMSPAPTTRESCVSSSAACRPSIERPLLLKEFNDLSYRQIAEVTGVPIGTVMSRLARAREELQTAWFELEKKAKAT